MLVAELPEQTGLVERDFHEPLAGIPAVIGNPTVDVGGLRRVLAADHCADRDGLPALIGLADDLDRRGLVNGKLGAWRETRVGARDVGQDDTSGRALAVDDQLLALLEDLLR